MSKVIVIVLNEEEPKGFLNDVDFMLHDVGIEDAKFYEFVNAEFDGSTVKTKEE